jgi:DtxR family Mn-dependent transcriptional regulator
MLPSATVENYLKALYQAETASDDRRLVPMGQLATAVGVAPGTATTMVKALAESGLVEYEPYTGVRLTPAGSKLAALVLRRHRLIEQFLVEIMGMSWTDVHDDAEKLEHVVSDRLVDRMDAMLGHPSVDPHGDPIPTPDGAMESRRYHSLLKCPLGTPVTVTRIADQDATFLRFLETQGLKPGQSIEVEARDPVADRVCLRTSAERRVILGTQAAAKVLIEIAQEPPPTGPND